MDVALLIKLVIAVSPVLVLLAVFERLDVFRLVSTGSVVGYVLSGAVVATLSYVANSHLMVGWPMRFDNYSCYIAPLVEESLKATVIVGLFALDRVGFKLDAAIAGFAVGAGFSVLENGYFLTIFPAANLGVWLVRGFGAAVMHGGSTALFAVITHEVSEHQAHRQGRHSRLYPWVFLPGLFVALAIHSTFNHFPNQPLLAMAGAMVIIPLTLLVVFAKGGATAHDWLEHDHETHAQMLADIRDGRFAETEDGRAIAGFTQRLPPTIAREAYAWIVLQLTLVLRAEELLLAHEQGAPLPVGEVERGQFRELHDLGRHIGRAGRHAIEPHLRFSRSDLYELHMLSHRVGAARRPPRAGG